MTPLSDANSAAAASPSSISAAVRNCIDDTEGEVNVVTLEAVQIGAASMANVDERAAAKAAESDATAISRVARQDECDGESTTSAYEHHRSLFLDPFPTPSNSIGSVSTRSGNKSPLHALFIDHDDFHLESPTPGLHRQCPDLSQIVYSSTSFQTPIKSPRGNSHAAWNDPFPTPDVSVHNPRGTDPFPSPDSQRCDSSMDAHSEHWCLHFTPPLLPMNDEQNAIAAVHNTISPSGHARRQSARDATRHTHNSTPSLNAISIPPIRRISSATDLSPSAAHLAFARVPSMDNFWKALRSGPDGNDLLDSPNRGGEFHKNNTLQRRNSLRRNRSRDNLKAGLSRKHSQDEFTSTVSRKQSKDDLVMMTHRATRRSHTTITARHPTQTRLTPLLTPVRKLLAEQGRRASNVYRTNSQRIKRKLKERRDRRRQRRELRIKDPPASWWIVIPADHPYKILWDVLTMIWAVLGAYRTHLRIRDRVFDQSPLIILTEIWFTLDILLNFVTEHKTSKGQVIRDGKTVWARYLTTWFVIDLLSLIPWERIYVRPVVEKIKKRNIFQKTFFRSKAVVRVSRVLRGRHIKLIGQVSKHTGTPLRRFVSLLIKYVPKYLLFIRHMKGALFVRGLRFVHWLHNMYKKIWVTAKKAGRNARRKIVLRKERHHPIFELEQEENDNDKENEDWDVDDGDDDDTATEDGDEDSDDDDDDEEEDATSEGLSEEEEEENQHISGANRTSHMGAMHSAALRHRSFSEM
ncbi:hypothetical protein HJC23_000400 [Cyclotella cryptica]|uniref:Ion transport domain-containing protein n=1 Tax=Cyclotella cryptica TaxID=29204 RepID=A0ABD3PIJ7_9STRA|eukprot:CCRYP_014150-RA/>CCRYP_014150-RA protein AED:0.00 eAED:0.00 QI:374/-1/1/1/-1/1/1/2418/747